MHNPRASDIRGLKKPSRWLRVFCLALIRCRVTAQTTGPYREGQFHNILEASFECRNSFLLIHLSLLCYTTEIPLLTAVLKSVNFNSSISIDWKLILVYFFRFSTGDFHFWYRQQPIMKVYNTNSYITNNRTNQKY